VPLGGGMRLLRNPGIFYIIREERNPENGSKKRREAGSKQVKRGSEWEQGK